MATELDDFIVTHPELHHYTTLNGLKGIFESRTLLATHYSCLNDTTEMKVLASHLERCLSKRVRALAQRVWSAQLSPRARHFLEYCNDPAEFAYVHAGALIDALQDLAVNTKGAYITSFSSHHIDKPFERLHGLLSQWRAYGSDDGCCIVFDTRRLADLLRREASIYYWNFITFEEVVYVEDDATIDSRLEALTAAGEAVVSNLLFHGHGGGFTPKHFGDFVRAASTLKHPAFREEREVRIVAMPASEADLARIRSEYGEVPQRLYKVTHERNPGGRAIPYLKLFDSMKEELPINRVIVGPSNKQKECYSKARAVLGDQVSVTVSEIPFAG
jgi:hypothetical protein